MTASSQQESQLSRVVVLLVLLIALISTIGFRADRLVSKNILLHDETISYLAATGHMGAFEKQQARSGERLSGRWVKARAWKSFLEIDRILPLQTIRADLARYDVHPPLYFWLLHLWLSIFGTEVWSGGVLNIILALGTFAVLFRTARYVLESNVHASAVVLIWSLSREVIAVSYEARTYDLLVLVTVLLVWQTLRILDSRRSIGRPHYALLAATVAAGFLTHYYFGVILAVLGSLLLLDWRRLRRRQVVLSLLATLTGVLIAIAVHPDFWMSFSIQQKWAESFELPEFLPRILRSIDTLLAFFGWRGRVARLEPLAISAMVLACGVAFIMPRILRRRISLSFPERFIVFYFVLIFGAVFLLYIGFVSPKHAMGAKYMAMVWPFAAFVPVLAIKAATKTITSNMLITNRLVGSLSIAYALLVLLPLQLNETWPVNRTKTPFVFAMADRHVAIAMKETRSVVFDHTRRGLLLAPVHILADETRVFAAMQSELLKARSTWEFDLSSGDLYVSALYHPNTEARRASVLRKISQIHLVRPLISEGKITVYKILGRSSRRSGTLGQAP